MPRPNLLSSSKDIMLSNLYKLLHSREVLLVVAGGAAVGVVVMVMMSRRCCNQRHDDMVLIGQVTALNCYPVKSLKGISHDVAFCTYAGMRMLNAVDRQFVIVRPNGDFITQRQYPKMAAIITKSEGNDLILTAPGMSDIKVPLHPNLNKEAIIQCRVWNDHLQAQDCGPDVSRWLSYFIGEPDLRLVVQVPSITVRPCSEKSASATDKLMFQDNAPFHITTEASLADVLHRIGSPASEEISMRNFRPNITIRATVPAWDEDNWSSVHIGKYLRMKVLEPMQRCLLTTVDTNIQIKRDDGEPLKTLKSFRIIPEVNKTNPLFGIMTGVETENTIRVGDPVYVKYRA